MNWNMVNEETKETKWALALEDSYDTSEMKYDLLTKQLSPLRNSLSKEPRLFDSKEDVMEWIKDIKERIEQFIEIPDTIHDNKLVDIQNRISKLLDGYHSLGSMMLVIMLHKEIEVDDFEDGIKVSYKPYKNNTYKNNMGYYVFKPVIVKKEK